MPYLLTADNLELFLRSLGAYEVFAPVEKQGAVAFKKLEPGDKIHVRNNPDFPPKHLFLKNPEEIYSYRQLKVLALSMERMQMKTETKRRILFGIRLCDLKALKLLDKQFLSEPADPFYKANRENTILIALRCKEPKPHCFCSAMDVKDEGYDLIFEEVFNGFLVETRSKVGEKLIDNRLFVSTSEKVSGHPMSRQPKIRQFSQAEPLIARNESLCLSCCACNVVCPTCGCFSFEDKINTDLSTGARERIGDYCQSSSFGATRRMHRTRQERYAHRLMCKFNYTKKNFSEPFCTGCGRCTISCPSGICDIPVMLEEVR